MEGKMIECANCRANNCYQGQKCVKGYDFADAESASRQAYQLGENRNVLEAAGRIEAEHYMQWTRLEEIMDYCRQMEYRRLGIAMCVGLAREAETLAKILSKEFTVFSICCKNGGISKDDFGLPHVKEGRFEATCNPVGQALLLNEEKTDLNIIVGLCIGHDILFAQYATAPCTTFVVKDRVLAHNPAAVLYSGYYQRKFGVR